MTYGYDDRSYAAQIFNRIVYRNCNSHRTGVGQYWIQTVYSNGSQPGSYAGNPNFVDLETDNNAIGVEMIRKQPYEGRWQTPELGHHAIAIRIYADGLGIWRPAEFGNLSYDIRVDITRLLHDHFDIIKTVHDSHDVRLRRPTYHIKRKPICSEFQSTCPIPDDFGQMLLNKYNIEGGQDGTDV